ncbi:MAG: YdgA family protein [Pusillimonas sp.]
MKKSVAVVGVVLAGAVAYGVSSWYVGQRAQDHIETAVVEGNSRLGKVLGEELSTQPVQLSISRYDRGWFSSSIIYSLKLTGSGGEITEFLLADKLQHGPFPWSAVRQGDLSPVLAISQATLIPSAGSQRWFDALDGRSPLSILSRIGFSGAGQSDWHFEPVDFTTDTDAKVAFGGGHLKMVYAAGLAAITSRGDFPSLSVNLPEAESFSLQKVVVDKAYSFEGNQAATIRVDIGQTLYTGADDDKVRLDAFSMVGESAQNNGLFDGSARYEVQALHSANINLGKVSAAFQVNRLDLKAFQALTSQYDTILSEQGLSDDDMADLDDSDVLRLREHLFELLKSKPSLALDPFTWDNGAGQSRLSAKFDFVRPDFALIDAPSDELLMQAIGQVDVSASVSKTMFARLYAQMMSGTEDEEPSNAMARMLFDMYAGTLTRTGLASYVDGVLGSAVRYKDGQVVVNGKSYTIDEFLEQLSLSDL